MTLLLLIPLAVFQHFLGYATACTIIYTLGNAVLSFMEGKVPAFIIGEAVPTIILSGLYFGFLARLDKERWVYWTLMILGGLLLAVAS